MRVLITGGSGLLGGRLADHLHMRGHHVVIGTRRSTPLNSLAYPIERITIDWYDRSSIERSCENIDEVIHTAGVNAKDSLEDPAAALWFNGVATATLVKAAIKQKVKQFIYFSTAHVYASPLVGTITEDTCPQNLHPYATTHLAGENAVLWANHNSEIKAFVFRLSNAFGYPVDKDVNCWMLLVHDLCRQAVHNRKMILRSDGSEQRNFIPITEVCRVADFFSDLTEPSQPPGIYNVGSDNSRKLMDMAILIGQRCKHVLGFEPYIETLYQTAVVKEKGLDYRTDKLMQTGYILSADFNKEIDMVLRYCQNSFK
jgi:UDP-glucose 4-epimerase